VTDQAPPAQKLSRLSPSSFEALRTCPLRLAFAIRDDSVSQRGDAQRIGEICHEVLESLVHDDLLRSGSWHEALEQLFVELLARHEGETGGNLRGARLAAARLRKVAGRMAAFLEHVPDDAQILTEAPLGAAGGRLFGRVDLIVRSPDTHVIVDYKTGAFLEAGTHRLKESYERQLMLYACLEAEASGTWPDQALLVPFGAEPVSLEVDPAACEGLLQEVIEALEKWETWVGAAPPANPSPEACGWCPFAARCAAFWAACTPDWKDTLLATRGRVLSSATTPLGGATLRIESREGSVIGTVAIRNVDAKRFPTLATMAEGRLVGIVGLRRDPVEGVFTLWPGARSASD
jgi:RecB family exonuclease